MKLASALLAAWLVAPQFASAQSFSCAQIKEKGTRALCLKDQAATAATNKADSDRAAALAASVASERLQTDQFVAKSKAALTEGYKDPLGAQFINLAVVTQGGVRFALCGSVNAKNSYGAFTGFHRFSVAWSGGQPQVWTEGQSTVGRENKPHLRENTLRILKVEAEIADLNCLPSDINVVTNLDSAAAAP